MDDSKTVPSYLEMIESMPSAKDALITVGRTFSFGDLARSARNRRRELLSRECSTDRSLFPIRESSVEAQLTTFLALSGTRRIPVIAPTDYADRKDSVASTESPSAVPVPEQACMAVMTSGTTGTNKILFRTFESWYDYFPILHSIFGINADSRIFTQGSLGFTGNLNIFLAVLAAGGAILAENQPDPRIWLRRIETSHANGIYLIPSKLRLLERRYRQKNVVNPHILTIISGSQSLGKTDVLALKEHFPMTEVTLYYGASELSYITCIKDRDMNDDPTRVGRPFPQIDVQIRDGRFLVTTAYGVIGTCTDAFIGDCGHQDEDGFFYFDGRADDICSIHGRRISSLRVENALLSLPGVAEAAVCAVHEDGREYLAAWLVTDSSACQDKTEAAIRHSLRSLLSDREIPRQIHLVSSLPRTDSGKIRYRQLSVR
ncbi:MAG: AMP-binding protein [Clostridiales bacterium]|nr:AMP-binding protein [Clostridiales bacterium]